MKCFKKLLVQTLPRITCNEDFAAICILDAGVLDCIEQFLVGKTCVEDITIAQFAFIPESKVTLLVRLKVLIDRA